MCNFIDCNRSRIPARHAADAQHGVIVVLSLALAADLFDLRKSSRGKTAHTLAHLVTFGGNGECVVDKAVQKHRERIRKAAEVG